MRTARIAAAAVVLALTIAGGASAGIWNVDAGGGIPIGAPGYSSGVGLFFFTVSGELPVITDVNVRFSARHTHDSDLDVYLLPPGQAMYVELFTDVGGSQDNFQETILDDQAATPITSGAAPFQGTYIPEGSLASLNGKNPNGVWALVVADDSDGDSGYLFRDGDAAPWGESIGTQLILMSVPEPAGLLALATGLVALGALRKRPRF